MPNPNFRPRLAKVTHISFIMAVASSESSLGMKQYSDAPAVGGNQPPTNSDDNLLDAIAGYYLPFDMN